MSINTEISRINNAKNAIISAIVSKGVVVVEGEKLDVLAEKIAQIETAEEPKTCTVTFNILQDGTTAAKYITDDYPLVVYTDENGKAKVATGFVVTKSDKYGAKEGYYVLECMCGSTLTFKAVFASVAKVTYDNEFIAAVPELLTLQVPSEPGSYVVNWTISNTSSWEAV